MYGIKKVELYIFKEATNLYATSIRYIVKVI